MNNRIKILILGVLAVLCTVLGIVSFNGKEEEVSVISKKEEVEVFEAKSSSDSELLQKQTLEPEDASLKTTPVETPREIAVFVCGEVNSPGVYVFHEGDRVLEAIKSAGGLTENADETYINQAGYLTDGVKLYFPSKEEAEGLGPGDSTLMVPDSSPSVTGLVNINTATPEELMTLPGVGQSKADSIINYRTEHGAFKRIEDIMNITGIKEGLFGKIKDKITV